MRRTTTSTTTPEGASPAGRAALVRRFGLELPARDATFVSEGHVKGMRQTRGRTILLDKRFAIADDLRSHLAFHLRHESVDLLFLSRLFALVPKEDVAEAVTVEPTGTVSRRIWFLYEWLTGGRLDLDDAPSGKYEDVLDPGAYVVPRGEPSRRHRMRDNMPGVRGFCPIVRRTPEMDAFISSDLSERARAVLTGPSKTVVDRAASFLLLADSRASYRIEGESPAVNRLDRWMKAVASAGRNPLSVDELVRLQTIVLESNRFVPAGLRTKGGFIGDHNFNGDPVPEFVSAKHEDVPDLLESIIAAGERMDAGGIDPVSQAVATSFGFVLVHPFVDGNGRLHRYILHHVLAERGFAPKGITFPISSVLLDEVLAYRGVLQGLSGPLMPFIDWRPTPDKNVSVANETADLYRYGDYTDAATFIYGCIAHTIDHELPKEIAFLEGFDAAKEAIGEMFDMPNDMLGRLVTFTVQNGGSLSRGKRQKYFPDLTDEETAEVESAIRGAFSMPEPDGTEVGEGGPRP